MLVILGFCIVAYLALHCLYFVFIRTPDISEPIISLGRTFTKRPETFKVQRHESGAVYDQYVLLDTVTDVTFEVFCNHYNRRICIMSPSMGMTSDEREYLYEEVYIPYIKHKSAREEIYKDKISARNRRRLTNIYGGG